MDKNFCKIYALCSGSGGNCVFVRVGENAILIDAGKSARYICRTLEEIGESIRSVKAIFLTHEHIDHVSAVKTLSKKYAIPVHMTDISAKKFDEEHDSVIHSVLVRHAPEYSVEIENIRVSSFAVSHDSLMCVGYRIEFLHDGVLHALGLATDTGYISESVRRGLLGCEAVIIESNHDEEMLMNGPYPRETKMRIASNFGHLSNRVCAEFSKELAENGTRGFMLAHISPENNLPCIARETVCKALEDFGVSVCVSDACRPVALVYEV